MLGTNVEDPETAERFVEAQYRSGRICYQVMADIFREHGRISRPANEEERRMQHQELMEMELVSVNVGLPRDVVWHGRTVTNRTGL